MMYSEFIQGTGCKENDHNYKVFKNLEIMYMNSDMSKAEIYEYGKKLVDNSKSEAELKLEAEIKERIAGLKAEIESEKSYIEWKTELMNYAKENGDTADVKFYKSIIKSCQQRILQLRREIAGCKFVLEGC